MKTSGVLFRSHRAFLIVATLSAALAGLTVFAFLRQVRSRTAQAGRLVKLVVAARNLEEGEVLDASSVTTVDFPDRYLPAGTFTDPSDVVGCAVHQPHLAGEPILESSLFPGGRSVLASLAVPEDFCAFPLPASATSFPVHLLYPGCRVDILQADDGEARPILREVEVLLVETGPAGVPGEETASYAGMESCVFLEVTMEEACRLAGALEAGAVEVVLLSPRRP
jgi:Flp pilus assembly protein CpaB